VTHQTVQRQTLANLQGNLSAMAALQAQMSSGKKISVPSEDPAGASDMLRLRGDQRALTQYARNASDGDSWLTTVDSALTSSLAALRRARDLTLQGGDGALGATSREALASELEGVRDSLLDLANSSYVGRNVFAGTSDAGVAFGPGYAYTGTAGANPVERRIGAATSVRVDSDGAAVFGTGTDSVFALLDTIAASLRSGADPTTHLDALDTHMEAMLTEVASVGARHGQVLAATSDLKSQELTVKSQLSGIEDIDLAEVILELQMQEVAYQGALGAASKVLQPSLMDFLR
jgi:flagellar hook-associated protein 3 FlgL